KGRMAAHLNSEVSPLRIDNVEMVMVDEPASFWAAAAPLCRRDYFWLAKPGPQLWQRKWQTPLGTWDRRGEVSRLGRALVFRRSGKNRGGFFVFAHRRGRAGESPPPAFAIVAPPAWGWGKAGSPKATIPPVVG